MVRGGERGVGHSEQCERSGMTRAGVPSVPSDPFVLRSPWPSDGTVEAKVKLFSDAKCSTEMEIRWDPRIT